MIIDNPDIFKTWLTSILEPLCDADPAALAKYVYALVKKDKPLDELRDGMLDQLDVFLQRETKPFVEMLFKSLETKEYLKEKVLEEVAEDAAAPAEPPAQAEPEPESEAVVAVEEKAPASPLQNGNGADRDRVVVPRERVAAIAPHRTEQTLVKVLPTELLEEPLEQLPRRRDRRTDSAREREERRRRGERGERGERAGWERRGRGRRRSPPPPPPPPRRRSNSRSRSPVPRKRPLERERERRRSPRELERDRMSRDRDHRDRVSMPRDRDRSRDRSRSPTPLHDSDRLSPLPMKRRCRDFDEKGYCMRGDLCQWDHGADPLVLEDASAMALTEYNPAAPDIWSAPAFPLYAPPPRELVPIPRIREPAPIPAAVPAPPRIQHKKPFDFARLGPSHRAPHPPPPSLGNCSLQVKKVPRGLNDITHLNSHFSKFGKIVNIQLCFENDPEAALITFSQPSEASVAYKSTEAVLNNRFIRLYWHKPQQSKQENVPPSNTAGIKPTPRPVSQHPASQNKVLINTDNVKDNKANAAAAVVAQPAGVEKPKEPAPPTKQQEAISKSSEKPDVQKQVMEMHSRAQQLLQTQLRQQTLLINKLESGQVSEPQKQALVEAIRSAQEGIEKLQKELVAYSKMIQQVKASKRPKTREEAQKEILDAELDMFTKQQEGQDVTDLAKKIAELRRNMAIQYPSHPGSRRSHLGRGGRFNPSTRFVRNNIAPTTRTFNKQSVDHRPRSILVSGFEADECQPLLTHMAQFGEIIGKEVNLSVPEVTIQFKCRAHAELAAARGRHFNERTLSITWVANNKPLAQVSAPEVNNTNAQNNNEEASPQEDSQQPSLLRFDEEDDDEDEDRSWRR